jgi:hypothetical protein
MAYTVTEIEERGPKPGPRGRYSFSVLDARGLPAFTMAYVTKDDAEGARQAAQKTIENAVT